MFAASQQAIGKSKGRRKSKLAEPTGAEILEKAAREARPNSPAEHRKIELAGQAIIAGAEAWPTQQAPTRA